jgi:sensor domain CHASE-containing protein
VAVNSEYKFKHLAKIWFLYTHIICCRIISSAEDVMERSLRLVEEARQALHTPESPSNAQNLAQVAKDVSQVIWVTGRLPLRFILVIRVFSAHVSR